MLELDPTQKTWCHAELQRINAPPQDGEGSFGRKIARPFQGVWKTGKTTMRIGPKGCKGAVLTSRVQRIEL